MFENFCSQSEREKRAFFLGWSVCYRPFCGPGDILILSGSVVFTTGRFMLSLDLLFVLVFFSPFIIVITSLGEERAGLCASRAFVCLFCTRYVCPFRRRLGVRGWLRLVIVALPRRFY